MRVLCESSVRELMENTRKLKADTEDPLYTRHLIGLIEQDSIGEKRTIPLVDDTIIHKLIQVGDLLRDVVGQLESEAKAHSADPMQLGLNFSTFSDRQHKATSIPQPWLVEAANIAISHRPHASDVIGPGPNKAQCRQQYPDMVWDNPSQPPRPQAPKMAELAPNQPLQRLQAFNTTGAAPVQLPRLQALDIPVAALNQPLRRPQAPGMAGEAPYQYPSGYMPHDPERAMEVPIQRSYGPQAFGIAKATLVKGNQGQEQRQSSNLGKPTQIINRKRKTRSANSVNSSQDGNRRKGEPHSSDSVNPAQVTHGQGRQQASNLVKTAPIIDLTYEQTPNGPNMIEATLMPDSQAPNLQSHHTRMAGNGGILKESVTPPQCMYDDPLDTKPDTPIPTSDAAQGEQVPPDRVVGEELAPDSAVVDETEEAALLVGTQLQDIPKASTTRKRKHAGAEETAPAARALRSARGRLDT